MPQLAKIQTSKISLNELIQNSLTIQSLPEEEKKTVVEKIRALPVEKQKEVAEVLLKEKEQLEVVEKEGMAKRQGIIAEFTKNLQTAVKNFKHAFYKEAEKQERVQELKKEDEILTQINQQSL